MAAFLIGFEATQSLPQPNEMVPKNGIIQWHGAIIDIPDGYALCDGNNGTPDLRDKFVVGAGDSYNPDDEGGGDAHNHDVTTNGHTHTITTTDGVAAGTDTIVWDAGADTSETNSSADSGTTTNANHLPPFYALAYIMRLV